MNMAASIIRGGNPEFYYCFDRIALSKLCMDALQTRAAINESNKYVYIR